MSTCWRGTLGTVLFAVLSQAGCDDVDWPEPRYIDSLRVIAVRADPPTPPPGGSTRLSLVCADGRGGPRSDPSCEVEVAWFAGCENPRRNDPDTCFGRWRDWGERLADPVAATPQSAYPDGFGLGPEFEHVVSDDVLSGEIKVGEQSVRMGTSYVFFAACAGKLVPRPGVGDRLPVDCRDGRTGELLDQRSLVVGVTTVYSYDTVVSRNPSLLSPRFDDVDVPASCAAADDCPAGYRCSGIGRCAPVVPVCPSEQSDDCQEHCLTFALDEDSFSLFSADGARLAVPAKSLWLDISTNAGKLPLEESSFRVRPPPEGAARRRTPCIRWQAPTAPTSHAHLWAVVRDNRGGLDAWDLPIVVE